MNDLSPFGFTVTLESIGRRLDSVLSARMPEIARSKIQKLIHDKCILLNGVPVKKNERLRAGDVIAIDAKGSHDLGHERARAQDIDLDIVYEDEYLLAVNKPAGMVVHPGNGNPDNTLVNALLFHVPSLSKGFEIERPGIVHRLDKDTSGILLVAKTDVAHAALAKMFFERTMEKNYTGLCVGLRPKEHATIDGPLGRNKRDPIKRAVHTEGKNANTEYWLLHYYSGISLVHFRPHTGRTHQIRVHCASVGFPILCDTLYGGGKDHINTLAVLERVFAHKLYKCFNRQALHAHRICFTHPFTKKSMAIKAPFPDDFKAAFKVLGVDEPNKS